MYVGMDPQLKEEMARSMRRQHALDAVLDIGIYPKSVVHNGQTTEREPFGDGWNAHAMEVLRVITQTLEEEDWVDVEQLRAQVATWKSVADKLHHCVRNQKYDGSSDALEAYAKASVGFVPPQAGLTQ